jgi:hypothetical protein
LSKQTLDPVEKRVHATQDSSHRKF